MVFDDKKSDDLSVRISQAQSHQAAKPQPDQTLGKTLAARNIGADFIGAVVGSGLLGALLDWGFGTMPWCSLGMIMMGFVVGLVGAWRSMQKSDSQN